jgi:hypothetical protein
MVGPYLDPPTIKGTHNLIPRHNLPQGNLSNQANPYWEAVYYLKYGLPPPKLEYNGTDMSRVTDFISIMDGSTHNQKDEEVNEGLEEIFNNEPVKEVDEVRGAMGTLFRVSRDGVCKIFSCL